MRPVKCSIPSKHLNILLIQRALIYSCEIQPEVFAYIDICMHNKCVKNICEIGRGVVMVFYCLLLSSHSTALTKHVFYTTPQNSELHVPCLGNQRHKTNHVQ